MLMDQETKPVPYYIALRMQCKGSGADKIDSLHLSLFILQIGILHLPMVVVK